MENKLFDNKISIALCTYNGAKYLRKQLDSILSQSYLASEIIVVDDCSKDETREILVEYSKNNSCIKLFFNEKNLGSNLSFRKAISLANNDFIALCDQDDIWLPNKLEIQIKKISELNDPITKPILSFHDLKLMNDDELIVNESFWQLHGFDVKNFVFKDLFLFNMVTGCTCIINQEMKAELLKSDMKDIIMHDYLIALIAYGFGEVIYHDIALMLYRSHSNSVTTKEKVTLTERVNSFIKRANNKQYLMPNILQVQEFLTLYQTKLSTNKLSLSQQFVSLKDKSVLTKMKYKWLKK